MQLLLVDRNLAKTGELEVAGALLTREWNGPLVHRLTVAHAANGRAATRKQKTRAEVKHTTARLYRQKGTGRARAGMSSSPIRRGGGRAFPSSPRDNLRKELNRKEFRAGMATVLSQLAREKRLVVAEELSCDQVKTKAGAANLKAFGATRRTLFVDTEFDEKFALSMRNLPKVSLAEASALLAPELLRCEHTIISKRALAHLSKVWA